MAADRADGWLERLVALEADVRYQELPSEDEVAFGYVRGQMPILLSAPHGAVHTRRGQLKEEDEYTAGMAFLVAELTGAHALYARRRSNTDPNWYAAVPYKRRLEQVVRKAGIRFVLDLHAAAATREARGEGPPRGRSGNGRAAPSPAGSRPGRGARRRSPGGRRLPRGPRRRGPARRAARPAPGS